MEITERIIEDKSDVIVISYQGKLVQGFEHILKDKIYDHAADGRRKIILDMSGITYTDSAGFGSLISIHATLKRESGRLILCDINKRMQDLLNITKFATVFEIADSEEEALVMLERPRKES